MLCACTRLCVFGTVSVTSVEYRNKILAPYVCLSRCEVGLYFILMDDNVHSHTVHLIDEFPESEDIR